MRVELYTSRNVRSANNLGLRSARYRHQLTQSTSSTWRHVVKMTSMLDVTVPRVYIVACWSGWKCGRAAMAAGLAYSGNVVRHMNEVKLRRARLVLGLVTTFGEFTIPVFIHATQDHSAWPYTCVGRCNEYRRWFRRNGASEVTTLGHFISQFTIYNMCRLFGIRLVKWQQWNEDVSSTNLSTAAWITRRERFAQHLKTETR